MPTTIAATDLHARTADVLEEVSKTGSEYIVTDEGRPVARLSPVEAAEPAAARQLEAWQRYARAALEIRRSWPAGRSSRSALDDVRRSSD